jgi:hypothetical protein
MVKHPIILCYPFRFGLRSEPTCLSACKVHVDLIHDVTVDVTSMEMSL